MTFRTRVRFPPPPPSDPGTTGRRRRRLARVARTALPREAVAWIEDAMGPGARVTHAEAMPTSSTAKHVVDVAWEHGAAERLVLRRYHDAERLAHDPWYVPAHEALALKLVAGGRVPAPRLHAADIVASACDVPALLESWLAGEPAWNHAHTDAFLTRAANVLVAIHAVRVPEPCLIPCYAPYRVHGPVVSPAFTTRRGLWEEVAGVLASPPPAHRETFIHRDYHPGNVLWDGARVTGVVDWATAAWGPPGIDLVRMRLNLASRCGPGAADRFASAYEAAGGEPGFRHPFWDLLDAADALADTAPQAAELDAFARFEDWVARVLAEVAGR